MNATQILEVLKKYEESLISIEPNRADYDLRLPPQKEALEHASFMCGEIRKLVAQLEYGKAHRWLGFLQGVLWTHGIYSINDMRAHNR